MQRGAHVKHRGSRVLRAPRRNCDQRGGSTSPLSRTTSSPDRRQGTSLFRHLFGGLKVQSNQWQMRSRSGRACFARSGSTGSRLSHSQSHDIKRHPLLYPFETLLRTGGGLRKCSRRRFTDHISGRQTYYRYARWPKDLYVGRLPAHS